MQEFFHRKGIVFEMMTAKSVNQSLELAGDDLCRAGTRLIRALDRWIEWRSSDLQRIREQIKLRTSARPAASAGDLELAQTRERLRTTQEFLHRLFPDDFADTNTAAE